MNTDKTKSKDSTAFRNGKPQQIKGWGVDADPENDPTYPLRKRTNEEHRGYSWPRPTQQPQLVEVLSSPERPHLPAVFGTSVPPSGLSGVIRRMAFRNSESSYVRWMSLVLADRLGVMEGIIDDLRQGHIPNIFAEKGLKSEWKYNRSNFIMKIGATALAAGLGLTYLLLKKGKNKRMVH